MLPYLPSSAEAASIDLDLVIVDGATPQIDRDLAFARRVFEQIDLGIHINSLVRRNDLPTTLDADNFSTYLDTVPAVLNPTELTVWYVPTVKFQGKESPNLALFDTKPLFPPELCQFFCPTATRYGVALSNTAVNDSLAHTIGEILLDLTNASSDPKNLIAGHDIRQIPSSLADVFPRGLRLDQISDAQAIVMKQSSFYVPAPSTLSLLVVSAMVIAAGAANRRSRPANLMQG